MASHEYEQIAGSAGHIEELSSVIADKMKGDARIAVIAGSGLGGFVRGVETVASVLYADLPHVGASTVVGHTGTLVYAKVAETPVFILNGRRHLYEGLFPRHSTLLLRALLLCKKIEYVIISNAAGGLNPKFHVGDLMLISDHINWTFRNPLIGPNKDEWGMRFPDLSDVYSREVRRIARDAACDSCIPVREGVYIAGHGPSYETRAEVGMLRHIMGADAVGMSTVPEALVCAHMGRKVLGISFISNLLLEPAKTTHEEVMENSRKVEEKFSRLLQAVIPRL